MNTNEKVDVVVSTMTPNAHSEAAQARLQEVRQMRELIPHFVLPVSGKDTRRLNAVASLAPEFVELTASAIANQKALIRQDGTTPAEMRDLMSYAEAYGPLADEYEAMGQFLRHSIAAARNKAGGEALATYTMAKRLAKLPRYAGLAVYVADMRRVLGKVRGKPTAEQLRKRADAAKAKADKAAQLTTQKS